VLHNKPYVHLRQYLAEFLVKKEMFQTHVADKIGTNILRPMPSEQESGWTQAEPAWTLWTGNKETHFQNSFFFSFRLKLQNCGAKKSASICHTK
jgi:hypothetical protein